MGPRTGSDHFRGEREWHTFSIELSQTSGQAMEIRFMPLFGVVYLRELKWKTREQLIRPHVMATEGAFADFATDGSIRICTFGEAPHLAIQIPESLQGGFLMFELQFVVGNLLEPRFLSKSLNLSTLVILFALGLWGAIWGVLGMFLSVPITVMMLIVFAHFEASRPIAILLSKDGHVKKAYE